MPFRLRRSGALVLALAAAGLFAACAVPGTTGSATGSTTTTDALAAATGAPSSTTTVLDTGTANPRPAWLGTRALPVGPNGFAAAQPTPPELVDRRLVTVSDLPPPAGDGFESSIEPVSLLVAARSSWNPACPVALADLRYVKVSFFGFDGRFHTGELLVHASVAPGMVEVFRQLHAARFPIEEMRIPRAAEMSAPPTGDGNDTASFACRPATGSTTSWSRHTFGLAIDVNPFHNPYVKGAVVLPELATAYLDRGNLRPGMIVSNDVVVRAFRSIGWEWGGDWKTLKDYQHFSDNGR